MRIGIEIRHILLGSSGGIAQNLQGLFKAAFTLFPQDEFFVYCTCFNRSLLDSSLSNVHMQTLPARDYYTRLAEQAGRNSIQVMLRAYPHEEELNFPDARQIVYIPDIQHETFPEFFDAETLRRRRQSFNRALIRMAAVATISNFAMQTLRSHPWTQVEDFFLVSPALQEFPDRVALSAQEEALLPQTPFFYFPANLWPHKNHARLLEAFAGFLKESGQPVELILTGHPTGWEALQARFPGLPVRHLGFTSPGMVRALYDRALALTFFSLYEGFGIPLLEAFASGTPVLCSNTTSLPEVGGDAVLSCDPTDVEAMTRLMLRAATEPALRAELAVRGHARLKLFTWENSARNFMQACRRVDARASAPAEARPKDWQPLVTIVTPSYNQARFLRRTIESVLNQTYPNIEYIVMDGGSTDGSLEILASYGDRFFWRSEKDRGQTHAINKGMALAHGEVLAYLNSDDTLEPDALERAVGYFAAHPEWDMLYGRANYIDEDDRVTGMYATDEYSFKRLVYNNPVCQPASFWRARIARLTGPFDESLFIAMDHDYWMRIDRAGGCIHHVHDILASSRMYAENKTTSSRERAYQEIFKISRKHAGYVSIDYYIGYWYYLAFLKNEGWQRWLRYIPRSFLAAAHLQYYRQNGGFQMNVRSWLRYWLSPRLVRRLPVIRSLRDALAARKMIVGPNRPVFGVFPDNYLGPVVQIYSDRRPVDPSGYLAGYALMDTNVRLESAGQVIKEYLLHQGEYTRLEFPAGAGPYLRVQFERHIRQPSGGRTSFFLADTNLFTEQQAFPG